MVRLSTQPPKAKASTSSSVPSASTSSSSSLSAAIPLRSNFFALPTSPSGWIFARLQPSSSLDPTSSDDDDPTTSTSSQSNLFVTNLPLGCTVKSLKKCFGTSLGKVIEVKLIEDLGSTSSLLQRELAASSIEGSIITPLFASTFSLPPSSPKSAIISFSSPPSFPPPPSSLPLSFPASSLSSFISTSLNSYNLSRPHLSSIIAHTDTWISSYDATKLAALPPSYVPPTPSTSSSKKDKKSKKPSKDVGPLPGSAAFALAAHAASIKKSKDRSFNPDEEDEGEWTLVTRGGKHGKSLIPAGAKANQAGYGGTTVGVVGKKRVRGDEESEEEEVKEVKKIVGDGFYRFTKEDKRKKELAALKSSFEEDKDRLNKFRESGGRGRGGRGRGGGQRGGLSSRGRGGGTARGNRFKPY